jgi:hypothetical protein
VKIIKLVLCYLIFLSFFLSNMLCTVFLKKANLLFSLDDVREKEL